LGAIAAVLMVKYDFNWGVTIMISLMVGALIGAFQGYWVAYVKIPAFIVTLAGMLIFRGLTLVMLQGEAVGPFPTQFQKLSSGFIPDFFNYEGFHITTIVIGALLSVLINSPGPACQKNQQRYGFEVTPFYFFVVKNIFITWRSWVCAT
jgi:putative multiple sugar transport system permease protein